MMAPTKWERLFEAGLPRPTFSGYPLAAHAGFPGRLCYSPAPGAVIYLDDEDAAALIRDNAVSVLEDREYVVASGRKTNGFYLRVSHADQPRQIIIDDAADKLDALYRVWCKMLGIEAKPVSHD